MEIIYLLSGALIAYISYRTGIKDGQRLKADKTIEPIIKSPLNAIKERKEAKEEKMVMDKITEGVQNLFAYDGTPQKEVD